MHSIHILASHLLTPSLLKDKGSGHGTASKSAWQGHEKAPDAINFSDEEDMIDDEDAPSEAQHAPSSNLNPQYVFSLFT